MSFPPSLDYPCFCGYKEPNIVKAQFILSSTRIYTLEFDQNISMSELKIMIQKAARLRSRNFRIFSKGEEYTKYNDETFESFFHDEKLVVFHIEVPKGENSEYLLEMNCPCNYHIDKFLLYYCYTCRESICSECFTNGIHKGHNIQDKCFYLLPTKFLVDKLFEKSCYQKCKYIEDQILSKVNIDKKFDKLFLLLKDIQNKVTKIIEQYHCCNYQSFERIRDSMANIKVYSIKLLDDLKEKMNIKEIINDDQLFLDFDKAYKKLGKLQNDLLNYNIISYNESCQQIPSSIKNMINDINDTLLSNLNQISNDQRYDIILNQIKIKAIKNLNIEDIDRQVKAHIKKKYVNIPKKRLTDYFDNCICNDRINPAKFEIISVNDSFHSAQGKKPVMKLNLPFVNSEIHTKRYSMFFNNNLNDSSSSNGTIKNLNQIAEDNLRNNYINNITIDSTYNNINNNYNNKIPNNIINSYVDNNKLDRYKYFSFGINNNLIPEEVTETETESNISQAIRKILNKEYILAPITQTNTIKILTSDQEELIINVKMPYNIGINTFLLNSAYCNMNKVLYITGGVIGNKKSNILLSVNLNKIDQTHLLNPMKLGRSRHTMISYGNKYLFAIGGENTSSVERYNVIENIWENISPMNYKRMYPILAINDDYLYALFGKSNNNEYCNTIERIWLKDIEHAKWEIIYFTNPDNIDTRIYGCATYISNNRLFLLGGKCNEKTTDTKLFFDFDRNLLGKEEVTLSRKYSFKENKLYRFNGKLMQISDENSGIWIEIV